MSSQDITMKIKMGQKSFAGIKDLDDGKRIDENQIEELCQFVDARYDCADFRAVVLLKTVYEYNNLLSDEIKNRIKTCLLNFKYWMDEPGEDSLCYWSENHQLIFHTCEYIAGQLMPNDVFSNNKMTGKEHMTKAHPKILQWLEHKFKYGFIEWHSNTYYEEDIAPLILLVDYANDKEIVQKAKIILDLLLLDMAMFSFNGYFSGTSGRCYEKQKKDADSQDTLDIYRWAFDENYVDFNYERLSAVVVLSKNYKVPQTIKAIAQHKDAGVIKDSVGLSLKEVKKELGNDIDCAGAFLWQMEAFTNSESINISMDMFNKYRMKTNIFLKDMQQVNIPILQKLNLFPPLVKILNPSTQGVVIQRSNNYYYKKECYMLSTSMRYHPGEFGDQHHIWHASLPNNIQVFATHPGAPFFDDNARNFSPSYWVGNGILPDAVQYENIHISIYNLNKRKGFLERERPRFTHLYFPFEKFDEVKMLDTRVFGKTGDTYIQIIGKHTLEKENTEEIIQRGKVTMWICELACSESEGSFEDYIEASLKVPVNFSSEKAEYKDVSLKYNGVYMVAGERISTEYKRLESVFANIERKPEEIAIKCDGMSHYINLKEKIRK